MTEKMRGRTQRSTIQNPRTPRGIAMIRASMNMKDRRRPSATIMTIVGGLYGIGEVNGVRSQSLRRLSIESSSSASPSHSSAFTASPSAHPFIAAPTMSPSAVMEIPSTTNSTGSESFRLRLHWQPGYRWQESDEESWFCAACAFAIPKSCLAVERIVHYNWNAKRIIILPFGAAIRANHYIEM